MKIQFRIFLGFAVILFFAFYFLLSWILPDMNVQPKKSMEEALVDTSQFLAVYLQQQLTGDRIAVSQMDALMKRLEQREFLARIYELDKTRINFGVYITDRNGIVLYHSKDPGEIGKNYYHWLDVHNTLIGEYGARTTRLDPGDPVSSVAYVAAPVYHDHQIIGSVTVFKPWKSIHSFTQGTRQRMIIAAVIGFLLAVFLSYLISIWITRPVWKLIRFAEKVNDDGSLNIPELGSHEMKVLGDSLLKMRDALQGKEYIEDYIQNLTHQIKGPLSSVKGAAELLLENLPERERKNFIETIIRESDRMRQIVEKLLQLASLEKRKAPLKAEPMDFGAILEDVLEEIQPLINQKKVSIINQVIPNGQFYGEVFLIREAVKNLLLNAVDFTPPGGNIEISNREEPHGRISLIIRDNGIGIPPYALPKVFDRFYSLPRPSTGEKSSGLGLSIVKEIALLHKGEILIRNNAGDGVTAILSLSRGVAD